MGMPVPQLGADWFHAQIFYDDGSPDEGFFSDNKVRSDTSLLKNSYEAVVSGLDDPLMHQAVKNVKARGTGAWNRRGGVPSSVENENGVFSR